MKKLVILAVLCLAGVIAGCSTLDTPSQRNRRIKQIADLQLRMAVDDLDCYLLFDRSSKLSQWHPRVGY